MQTYMWLLFVCCWEVMNAARIHDKQKLRSFWEEKIVSHSQQMDKELTRMRSSALTRSAPKLSTLVILHHKSVMLGCYSTSSWEWLAQLSFCTKSNSDGQFVLIDITDHWSSASHLNSVCSGQLDKQKQSKKYWNLHHVSMFHQFLQRTYVIFNYICRSILWK